MPKVSEAHAAARRRGILAAAQRCFARNGIRGTTMRDICRAANLSPGALYLYFDGKESILEALAERRAAQIDRFVADLGGAGPEDFRHRLADRVAALADPETAESLSLDLALWSEAAHSAAVRRILGEALAERAATAPPEARDALRLGLALLQGIAVQRVLDPALDLGPLVAALRAGRLP